MSLDKKEFSQYLVSFNKAALPADENRLQKARALRDLDMRLSDKSLSDEFRIVWDRGLSMMVNATCDAIKEVRQTFGVNTVSQNTRKI